MLNIIIFGAPGSGKGTQSANIVKKYNLAHISTGELLRTEKKMGNELGKLAESFMKRGHLIPDILMISLLSSVYDDKTSDGICKGVVLDGFPRTMHQGEALDKMFERRGQSISAVINLEVAESELIERLITRGQKSGRSDDNYETIKARLDVYTNQTEPLKEYYRKQGILHTIKGLGTVDEIFERISAIIDSVK
ncbi:adenylate kinase [Dysgonomonas sp. PH5-45]|uniref:adenylate kinase n=1 Tax=unclassified Dysgonomonas TaxID=2630389 RepID=UPI002475658F|nr:MULTISPECIES: adenylate kinase [unclassified Dysgonomonas]MDH6355801.1 adenylate kinase [Dysgonomonas sp. PH5-45]MDH6388698.1 adenylate kinase [Dysgonomonas sp. PH5-37]